MISVSGLLADLGPDGTGTLSLAGAAFLEPAHLVGAAAEAEAARRAGRPFVLRPPTADGTSNFACRMRLGRALRALGYDDPLGTVRENPLGGELLEVTALASGTAASLAGLVSEKVRGPHGHRIADTLFQSTAEIGQNAEAYAGAIGYAAAVTVPRRRELLIAVADRGVGFVGTLAVKGASNDGEALRLALQGVSSRDGRGGSGVRHTLEAVRLLGGSCLLVSGEAAVTVRGGRQSGPTATSRRYGGTLFQASIPLG